MTKTTKHGLKFVSFLLIFYIAMFSAGLFTGQLLIYIVDTLQHLITQ